MLEDWLRTLLLEKQKAITRIKAAKVNAQIQDSAIKEIEINIITVKNYLRTMSEMEYGLSNNLRRLPSEYCTNAHYRMLCQHVEHHINEITRIIPSRVERGNFTPSLSKHY
jgi:hypothetical protein